MIKSNPTSKPSNFNLKFGLALSGTCRFFGQSGMSTTRKFYDKLQSMLQYQPDVVFMILGGNDVSCNSSVDSIVGRLKTIVDKLYSSGIRRVFVGTIIERGSFWHSTGLTKEMFDKIRRGINRKLRRILGPDLIDVVKKLKFPKHYDEHLVHPGDRQAGLYLLLKSIERCFAG